MVTEKRRRDMADTNNYYARMYYTHDGARVLTKRKTNQVKKKIGEDETRNEKKKVK
jgi:predicted peroxiredoxin